MAEFTFDLPWAFLLIPVFIACAYFCKYRPTRLFFPHLELVKKAAGPGRRLSLLFQWLTILFLITALASPVTEEELRIEKNIGYDIVLAMDVSGSMQYPFGNDRRVSKFAVTKGIIADFIRQRQADNLAITAFGQYGFIVAPLTYDKELLERLLDGVQMNEMYSQGTAIGDAIAQSVKVLEAGSAKNRIVVLVTDGNEEGNVAVPFDKATAIAKKRGIKVYTVGIGRPGEFNARLLNYVAQETGARAFTATDPDALAQVYKTIDELEKSEIKAQSFVKKEQYYYLPLFGAIMALLLTIFFRNREEA